MKAKLPNFKGLLRLIKPRRVRLVSKSYGFIVEISYNKWFREWHPVSKVTGLPCGYIDTNRICVMSSIEEANVTFDMAVLELDIRDLRNKQEKIKAKTRVLRTK